MPKSWPESHSDDRKAIDIISRSVRFLGGDNLFRRYIFDDGRTLLTSGYSITLFDQPLTPDDLTKIEYTWSCALSIAVRMLTRPDDGYNMRFPQRPNVPEGNGKTTYYILDVDEAGAPSLGQPQTRLTFAARDGRRIDLLWSEV